MLKKTLKKILALTLTTVTLVTSAMPVSASTLTPVSYTHLTLPTIA